VLLASSHGAQIPLNDAMLPVPWAEVTPSCLRIQSRGAGWALSTPRVLAGFSNVRITGQAFMPSQFAWSVVSEAVAQKW
jgi:hypothetical protein